jgi:hypothetical protein
MSIFPLLALAEILTYITNILLKVSDFMMVLSLSTMFLMVFGITSLGVGIGGMYPRFKHDNNAEISSGFGGLIYMLYAMGLIGLTVALEARPTYLFITSQLRSTSVPPGFYFEVGMTLLVIIVLNVAGTMLPFRFALRNLDRMEGIE